MWGLALGVPRMDEIIFFLEAKFACVASSCDSPLL